MTAFWRVSAGYSDFYRISVQERPMFTLNYPLTTLNSQLSMSLPADAVSAAASRCAACAHFRSLLLAGV